MAIIAKGQVTLSSVVDVKATYRYYLLQSSTLAKPSKPTAYPPPSAWDDTEPTYTNGSTNSLYFVDCTVFSDDTYAYSAVSLSSSYEAAKAAYNKAAALEPRVVTAETNIASNKEAIELQATKLTRDYYTKTQTDAAIKVSSDAITSKVTSIESSMTTRNYIINSPNISVDNLNASAGSRKEYTAINVGQSYMDIPHNTEVTISFDLEMTVNTANPTLLVYNSNNKGPKTIDKGNLNFTAAVGDVIKGRYSVTTRVKDRTDATLPDNYIEFYSTYETSNWFKISKLKMELGTKATDWSSAPEDFQLMADEISGIDVGGRNLVLSTPREWTDVRIGTTATIARLSMSELMSDYGLTNGDKLTFSIFLKSLNGRSMCARWQKYNSESDRYGSLGNYIYANQEGYSSVTDLMIDSNYAYLDLMIYIPSTSGTNTTTEQYKFLMLEKGNKFTFWSPAPEDLDTRITKSESSIVQTNNLIATNVSETNGLKTRMTGVEQTARDLTVRVEGAEKVATNYLNFSEDGLVVGNHSNDKLGKNVRIDEDSVDIRDGNTPLARFAANGIELGKVPETDVSLSLSDIAIKTSDDFDGEITEDSITTPHGCVKLMLTGEYEIEWFGLGGFNSVWVDNRDLSFMRFAVDVPVTLYDFYSIGYITYDSATDLVVTDNSIRAIAARNVKIDFSSIPTNTYYIRFTCRNGNTLDNNIYVDGVGVKTTSINGYTGPYIYEYEGWVHNNITISSIDLESLTFEILEIYPYAFTGSWNGWISDSMRVYDDITFTKFIRKSTSPVTIDLCEGAGRIGFNGNDSNLEITGENLRLKADSTASLYSSYYNDNNYASKSSVNVSPNSIDIFSQRSENIDPETQVGTWKTTELAVDPDRVYALTEFINAMGRFRVNIEALTGVLSLTAHAANLLLRSPTNSVQSIGKFFVSDDIRTSYNDGKQGWYFGVDGTAHATHPTKGPTIGFHYAGSTNLTSRIDETASGTISINGMTFGINKVLWSGTYYMSASQTATLSEAVSDQTNGIVLVFSRYSSGAAQNYHFSTHFVPKQQIATHSGCGHNFIMSSDGSFGLFAAKYVYIHDTSIVGNAINEATGTGTCNIKYTNNGYVLRYVLGV